MTIEKMFNALSKENSLLDELYFYDKTNLKHINWLFQLFQENGLGLKEGFIDELPHCGIINRELAVLIDLTLSGNCYLDFVISPKLRRQKRQAVFEEVMEVVEAYCEYLGAKRICGYSAAPVLTERFRKRGYKVFDKSYIYIERKV